jgi:hypothetical protein
MELGRLLVDREAQAFGRPAEAHVSVDDEVDRLERFAHFGREVAPAFSVRPVDLGDERREHRRPGGNLDHLERRPRRQRKVVEPAANVEGDRVARPVALRLVEEVDREVALFGVGADVIVAHQAVEVERRRRPGIGLNRHELRQVLQPLGRRHQGAVGVLEARPMRQVEDDLDFRLVVERQKLHPHVLGGEQR